MPPRTARSEVSCPPGKRPVDAGRAFPPGRVSAPHAGPRPPRAVQRTQVRIAAQACSARSVGNTRGSELRSRDEHPKGEERGSGEEGPSTSRQTQAPRPQLRARAGAVCGLGVLRRLAERAPDLHNRDNRAWLPRAHRDGTGGARGHWVQRPPCPPGSALVHVGGKAGTSARWRTRLVQPKGALSRN